jgi:hypothetical protein
LRFGALLGLLLLFRPLSMLPRWLRLGLPLGPLLRLSPLLGLLLLGLLSALLWLLRLRLLVSSLLRLRALLGLLPLFTLLLTLILMLCG